MSRSYYARLALAERKHYDMTPKQYRAILRKMIKTRSYYLTRDYPLKRRTWRPWHADKWEHCGMTLLHDLWS